MTDQQDVMRILDGLDWEPIRDILKETTCQLRIGEQIEESDGATHVFMMPSVDDVANPDEFDFIDLTFIYIGVHKEKAAEARQRLVELLAPGEEAWKLGPSYMHVGAAIGDQGGALMLFALGRALNLWQILSPQTMMGLSRDHPLSQQMAGQGMVNIQGWFPDGSAEQEPNLPANVGHRTEQEQDDRDHEG
tara:strand:+ start:107801 stop:108373 length:573 start_codon:yes stop_codon:yes gene_type:complete